MPGGRDGGQAGAQARGAVSLQACVRAVGLGGGEWTHQRTGAGARTGEVVGVQLCVRDASPWVVIAWYIIPCNVKPKAL